MTEENIVENESTEQVEGNEVLLADFSLDQTAFLEATCEECLYQKNGFCLRYPPRDNLPGTKGTTKTYGKEPIYPIVAMTVKNNEDSEKLPSEYAQACAEFYPLETEEEDALENSD